MPEMPLGPAQLRVMRLASGLIYAASAVLIGLDDLWQLRADFGGRYHTYSLVVLGAAIGYFVSLAVDHWSSNRLPARPDVTSLVLASVIHIALAGILLWTWLRGADSRLLLSGCSTLLAAATVVLTMQTAWYGWQWYAVVRGGRSSETDVSHSLLQRLAQAVTLLAGLLWIVGWILLETLELPSKV